MRPPPKPRYAPPSPLHATSCTCTSLLLACECCLACCKSGVIANNLAVQLCQPLLKPQLASCAVSTQPDCAAVHAACMPAHAAWRSHRCHRARHAADELASTAYTLSYCPPELLKSKLGESQVVDDRLRDAFSLGVMLHSIFTCCNPNWQPAFDPPAKKQEALRRDSNTDPVVRRRALQTAVADQHASWVSMCPDLPHACHLPLANNALPDNLLVACLSMLLATSPLCG